MLRKTCKALLSLSLVVLPFSLVGCPALQQGTTPQAKAATGAEAAAVQTQSIKNNVAGLKAAIRQLVSSGMALQQSGQQSFQQVGGTSTQAVGPKSIFQVLSAGSLTHNGLTFTWGDDNQLASLASSTLAANAAFTGQGSTHRTAVINLTKSPDGTVGSATLDVTADTWRDFSAPFASASPSELASVQLAYDQYPDLNTLQNVAGTLNLTVMGQADQQLSLEAGGSSFDQFTVASQSMRIPSHSYLKLSVPKLALDQTLDIRKAGSTQLVLTMAGTLNLTIPAGPQQWSETLEMQLDAANPQAESSLTFSFENAAQKYKLAGTVRPLAGSNNHGGAVIDGQFVSTVDNSQLATFKFNSTTDRAPVITYADGSTETFAQSDFMPAK